MNIALYLLSFNYDTQDNFIDLLLNQKSSEYYTTGENYGKRKPLIGEVNEAILKDYIKICSTLKQKPSIETLKQKFPKVVFDGITPIDDIQLGETIKLDLDKLRNKDMSFKLMNLSTKVNNEGLSNEIISELSKLTQVKSSEETYKNIFESIDTIYENAEVVKGIPTGITQVDTRTGGLQPGTFNTLAGFAGAGKTTAAVNIAYNAIKEGKNVCYLTFEVPKVDMSYNFLSRHSFETKFKTPISHSVMKKKELSKQDKEYLFGTVLPDFNESLKNHLFILDETDFPKYEFVDLEMRLKQVDMESQKINGSGIDLVIVDQAQLLKFGGGISSAGNETSVINLYVSFFRQQAINFLHSKRSCTILMLSQINREGYASACKHEGRYNLTNLAESNELERASAIVIAIYSDESLKASKQVSIQMLKSRNGETIVDPVLTFMDPVYYVFGSGKENSGAMFTGSSDTILGGNLDTLDLSSMGMNPFQMGGNL